MTILDTFQPIIEFLKEKVSCIFEKSASATKIVKTKTIQTNTINTNISITNEI